MIIFSFSVNVVSEIIVLTLYWVLIRESQIKIFWSSLISSNINGFSVGNFFVIIKRWGTDFSNFAILTCNYSIIMILLSLFHLFLICKINTIIIIVVYLRYQLSSYMMSWIWKRNLRYLISELISSYCSKAMTCRCIYVVLNEHGHVMLF